MNHSDYSKIHECVFPIENIPRLLYLLDNTTANINNIRSTCYNLLQMSVILGNSIVVRILLDKGCDIDSLGPCNNYTALYISLENEDLTNIKLLLERGANANLGRMSSVNTCIYTPLHLAIEFELSYEIMELLLQHGADKNLKDRNGKSPIDRATELNLTEILELMDKY